MSADEVEGWDDWFRPARLWPLLLLTLAPVLAVALGVWLALRVLSS